MSNFNDEENISITEWLENPSKNSSWSFNFTDWFSSGVDLEERMLQSIPIVEFLIEKSIINPNKTKIWFKNNSSINVKETFDDYRFDNLKTEVFLGGVCPFSDDNNQRKFELWINEPEYKLYTFESFETFKEEIENNHNFQSLLQSAFSK